MPHSIDKVSLQSRRSRARSVTLSPHPPHSPRPIPKERARELFEVSRTSTELQIGLLKWLHVTWLLSGISSPRCGTRYSSGVAAFIPVNGKIVMILPFCLMASSRPAQLDLASRIFRQSDRAASIATESWIIARALGVDAGLKTIRPLVARKSRDPNPKTGCLARGRRERLVSTANTCRASAPKSDRSLLQTAMPR